MGYVVLHLDKSPSNEAAMTAHIARTQMPPNADLSRTHLNREADQAGRPQPPIVGSAAEITADHRETAR